MVSTKLNLEIIFLTQTGVGILGNSSLFCLYIFTLLTRHVLRPTDLILIQLVIANNLVLFNKRIPQTMATFELKYFLDDVGCKLVFYLHRVARGVSLSTTCLLSGFQAVKLNLNTSKWIELKSRFPKCVDFCCFLCWILHLLLNIFIAMNVTGPRKSKNTSMGKIYEYCSSPIPNEFVVSLHAVMFSFIDLTCLDFMAWSSGSMVLVLHRHKQQVQHIHSSSLSPRTSHEARATRTILFVVSIFISFYFLSSILSLWVTLIVNPSHWLMNTSALMSSGFPTFSPFVLLGSDTWASQFWSAFWGRKIISPKSGCGLFKRVKPRPVLITSRHHFPAPLAVPHGLGRGREVVSASVRPIAQENYITQKLLRRAVAALLREFPYVRKTAGRDFRYLPHGGHFVGCWDYPRRSRGVLIRFR
ncbi:hypothetical protein HPG69_007254, partial [Diceros bicornis minor]